MSWEATAWASKQRVGSPSGKLVLLVLADLANEEGYSYPSLSHLAEVTEQSRDTVRRRLRDLEELALLKSDPRSRADGSRATNGYWLLLGGGGNLPGGGSSGARGGWQSARGPLAPVLPREQSVESGRSTSLPSSANNPPPSPPSLEGSEIEVGREEVKRCWGRVRSVVLERWHRGAETIEVEGASVGMGLEFEHLAALVDAVGAEDAEAAVRAGPAVEGWEDGWPRSLAWFTSPAHGRANLEVALGHARKLPDRRRRTGPTEDLASVGDVMRSLLT